MMVVPGSLSTGGIRYLAFVLVGLSADSWSRLTISRTLWVDQRVNNDFDTLKRHYHLS